MKDSHAKIIYIGKAKTIKNRVAQYFGSQNAHSNKVKRMVEQVEDFDYIITDSEFEALILECSLIKQYMPKYNILLKDDKGYSYIKISNEDWPKITEEKQKLDDKATYLGPFVSSWTVKTSIDEARKIFKLPDCNKNFPRDIGKAKPCLNYYIKRCSAPCAGKIDQKQYMQAINDAVDFLKGNDSMTIKKLTKQMNESAKNLDFETAAKLRDRISAINKLKEKQKVVGTKFQQQDIIALVNAQDVTCFEVLRFSNSMLFDKEEFLIKDIEDSQTAITQFLQQYYDMRKDIPPVICINTDFEDKNLIELWLSSRAGKQVKIFRPKNGEQLELMNLCKKNAIECIAQSMNRTWKESVALQELKEVLNLKKVPRTIEAYDISNLAGSENVGAMVVFEDGRPLKSAYRKFKIKTVIGQNDYNSMKEVIIRRFNEYENFKNTDNKFGILPDLILLDGGRGHVSVITSALKEKNINIPVYGMVKDNRHKTRAITENGGEITISNRRQAFILISKIQEEVHRFAIRYHKTRRKKDTLSLELTKIPMIGEKRAVELLKHFKTLDAIKNADKEDLIKVKYMNNAATDALLEYFHKNA